MKMSVLKSGIIFALWMMSYSMHAQHQTNYQTFDFLDFNVKVLTGQQVNQDNIDYLKTAIAKELQAKGLRKESNPDLAVNIGVVVEEEVQTRETDYQDMHYMGQRNYYWEVQELPVGKYKVGTVSIELVDTENNKVVWQDSERNVINNNPKKVQRKIEKGAARIFKNFDPSQL